jgi:hypothetical protein
MEYKTLSEDLTKLIESYGDNPFISEHQRKIWKAEGRKKAITHAMFGNDHERALQLLKVDGYDGHPVGSLRGRSAESFWNYNDNHVFPPIDDLIRLGIFMHLDVYRILALALKGNWEEFFAREICEWRANVGKDLSELLQQEKEMEEALSRFNPDTGQLFYLLLDHASIDITKTKSTLAQDTRHGLQTLDAVVEDVMEKLPQYGIRWLVEARYSPDSFDTLVQTMLLNKMHWMATDSGELNHFKEHAVEEIVVCIQGTDKERHSYWRLTQARIQLLMNLDDVYLQVEGLRLQNQATRSKYLSIFGEHEIALREASFRCYELEQKILLKRADPELSWDDLDEQIQRNLDEMRKELDELKDAAQFADLIDEKNQIWGNVAQAIGFSKPLTDKDKAAYIQECKKILRDIYMLIHPDRLKTDPVYEKLTSEQRKELEDILHKVLEIKDTDLRPGTFIESRYRSPAVLREILDRVRSILELAGINVNPGLEIKGDTLPERLSWLEEDIKRIEGYIRSAKLELQAMMSDEDIQQKRSIISNEDKHEDIKKEMEEQTAEYVKKAEELDAELCELMGEGSA